MLPSTLGSGVVVVFEGLDATGKSTQLALLEERLTKEPRPAFVHMPSGRRALSQRIYNLTEQEIPRSGLARQLLHLAAHAENVPELAGITAHSGLVLDRWWWSTVAYGWYGGGVQAAGLDEVSFRRLIAAIWSPIRADLVFLFDQPHKFDANNSPAVREGYRALAADSSATTVAIPAGLSVDEVHVGIWLELQKRALLV